MGLFGGKKPQYVPAKYIPPPSRQANAAPSSDDVIHSTEMRAGNLQARVAKLEQEILNHKREMSRHRKGTASYNMAYQRAMQAMKQKKRLEGRLQNTMAMQFNMEHIRDAKVEMRDQAAMVSGLRQEVQQMERMKNEIDVDDVEDIHDQMQEVMEDANEISQVLGRNYDVGVVDDYELEAELNALEDNVSLGDATNVPSYLQPAPLNTDVQVPQNAQPQATVPSYLPAQTAHRY